MPLQRAVPWWPRYPTKHRSFATLRPVRKGLRSPSVTRLHSAVMPSRSRRRISFGVLMKLRPRGNTKDLTPAQRLLYASEKQLNFRTIAKICATRSRYVLGIADLATAETHLELAQLGQFAELAYAVIDPKFVFEHLDVFAKEGFPLEGYDALTGAKLVSSFVGDTAELPGYVAYRPETKQLVVAFSGTATLGQAILDLRFRKHKHPAGQGCKAHNGFWRLYKGCRPQALAGIRDGLQKHEVLEVVITGHSLGGALASLLALDLVTAPSLLSLLPPNVGLKIVGYGSPRVGNPKLVQVWRDALLVQREKGRQVQEYLVKAYNDGVPSLPPANFGFRHFAARPLYFLHGRLFHIPESENEHGVFKVEEEAEWRSELPKYPRGGHNYYSGRDLEGLWRRMEWVAEMMDKGTEWESGYLARVRKEEAKRRQSQ